MWALSLHALGRGKEALRELTSNWGLFAVARTFVEGRREDTIAGLRDAIRAFNDPEAFYYASRHFAHFGEVRAAIDALAESIRGGYACADGLQNDPWFDSIRTQPEFRALLERTRERYDSAAKALLDAGGSHLLRS